MARDVGREHTYSRRLELRYWQVVALVALVGVVVPLVVAEHFGALGIPRNDDWAYLLSAFRFEHTGDVNGYDWAGMNLVGQVVLALPVVWAVGPHIGALQVFVALLGLVGLVAVFDLGRNLLSDRRALFVALVVALGPLWAGLSVSFMTDVPAFACGAVSFALGARGLRGRIQFTYVTASLLVGLVGFTIRIEALTAPIVVLVAAVLTYGRRDRRARSIVLAMGAALIGAALLFQVWRGAQTSFRDPEWTLPNVAAVRSFLLVVRLQASLLGFLVFPAVALAGPVRLLRGRSRVALGVGIVVGIWLFGGFATRWRDPWTYFGPGNYVYPNGALGGATTAGTRGDLFPFSVQTLIMLAGIASFVVVTVCMAGDVADRRRSVVRRDGEPVSAEWAMVAIGAGVFFAAAVMQPLVGRDAFDRYLLPATPLLAILVLASGRTVPRTATPGYMKARMAGGLLALISLAYCGFVLSVNGASFDGAKWAVAQQLADSGTKSTRIDGSFEWSSYHAESVVASGIDRREQTCALIRMTSTRPAPNVVVSSKVWGPSDRGGWIVGIRTRQCDDS